MPLRNYIDTNLWVFLIYQYLYFFLLNLIIIIIIKFLKPMGLTQPNPTHVGWVGFMWWVEFFFTHHGGLGQKILSTQPMHISNWKWYCIVLLHHFPILPLTCLSHLNASLYMISTSNNIVINYFIVILQIVTIANSY